MGRQLGRRRALLGWTATGVDQIGAFEVVIVRPVVAQHVRYFIVTECQVRTALLALHRSHRENQHFLLQAPEPPRSPRSHGRNASRRKFSARTRRLSLRKMTTRL